MSSRWVSSTADSRISSGGIGPQLGLSGQQDLADALVVAQLWRVVLLHPAGELHHRRVAVRQRQPAHPVRPAGDLHRAPVGQPLVDDDVGQLLQGYGDVQRGARTPLTRPSSASVECERAAASCAMTVAASAARVASCAACCSVMSAPTPTMATTSPSGPTMGRPVPLTQCTLPSGWITRCSM